MRYTKELLKIIILAIVIASFLITQQVSAFEDVSFVNEIRSGFKKPVDVAVSGSGNIYILDSKFCKVSISDSAGYLIKVFGSCGSDEGEFKNPEGIALSPDGDIVVADTNNNRIQVFDGEGRFKYAFGNSGSERGELMKPSGVAVDEQGMIYVADAGNNRLQVFSAKGLYRFRIPFDVPPADVAIDAMNRAYVLLPEDGEIKVFNIIKNNIIRMKFKSSRKKHITKATSIAVDFRGDIYITEQAEHSAKKYDIKKNLLMTFGSEGRGRGQFKKPAGIVADDRGHIFIVDSGNKRLQEFNVSGSIKQALDTSGMPLLMGVEYKDSISTQTHLTDIRLAPSGTIYTLSGQNNSLIIKGIGNRIIGGRKSREEGQFNTPSAVDYGPKGYIYVADTGNNRVQVLDPDGNFVFAFGKRGRKTGQFKDPGGITVAEDGTIYVADTGNDRVQIFNKDGIFLKAFGKSSDNGRNEVPGKGTFRQPTALALDSKERLFVVDQGNNRIQVFDNRGIFLQSIGEFGDGYKQFDNPVDIALTSNDILLVADAGNNRVQVIHPELIKFQFTFGSGAEGLGQFSQINGIDVDDNNNIYVTDSDVSAIRVFTIVEGRKRPAAVMQKQKQPVAPPAPVVEEDKNQEFELK